MGVVRRGEVWLVDLDPAVGSEIRKTRPCAVVSPDELNGGLRTVLVAPMTTAGRAAPFRPAVTFGGKAGLLLCDQIRALDKTRLVRRQGRLDSRTLSELLGVLTKMFAT